MVFDTNVLVHAVDDDSEYQDACARFLNSWRNGQQPAYLTWGICYEFLRVVTHPRVLRLPWDAANARDFLGGLLTLRGFQMLVPSTRHQEVLAQTIAEYPDTRGNVVHDLHTAVLMREQNVDRICTRDGDLRRFSFVTAWTQCGRGEPRAGPIRPSGGGDFRQKVAQ